MERHTATDGRCAAMRATGSPARWVSCGYAAGHRGLHAARLFGGPLIWTTPGAEGGR